MSKNDIINNYFKLLGVKKLNTFDEFIDYLEEKYDEELFQNVVNELINRIDEKKNYFYSVKNSDFNLSIDFSSWSYDMYKKLFEEFIMKSSYIKENILDIGCDNGFITCFMAMIYKDKYFYGVDTNKNGIAVARDLKKKLNLKNVEFDIVDIKDLDMKFKEGFFDNIISVRVIHEANDIIKKLNYVLKKTGTILSFERLIDFNMLIKYVDNLYEYGLNVDISNSKMISFNELEDNITLPLLIINKENLKKANFHDLSNFYNEKTQT